MTGNDKARTLKQHVWSMLRRVTTKSNFNQRIAFLHIPKTAGTSLNKIIELNCPTQYCYQYYPPHLVTTPPEIKLGCGVLSGHFVYGYANKFFDQYDHITFLRDPLERVISHLHWTKRYHLDPSQITKTEYTNWFENNPDPFEFIAYSKQWYFDNATVRMLAGVSPTLPFGSITQDHYLQAQRNLQKFNFVGFQKTFAQDLKQLCKQYKWLYFQIRRNTDRHHSTVNAHRAAQISDQNKWDIALYEFALNRQ